MGIRGWLTQERVFAQRLLLLVPHPMLNAAHSPEADRFGQALVRQHWQSLTEG
jgi:hypothetical protein